jgi:polyphosphate glucokinase
MTVSASEPVLGIDVGGTGIKGAMVDLESGYLISDRFRLDTPEDSKPEAVSETILAVVDSFGHAGLTGVTFPGVIHEGVAMTAANLDKRWIGTSLVEAVGKRLHGPSVFVNDADAAGLAEVAYGAGQGHRGLVMMITFGTGIGTALIHDGRLIPNAELGHIEIDGVDAETTSAVSARKREDLSWEEWAGRASRYLQRLEVLVWPELFILGGGISKKSDKWLHLIENRTPLTIAKLINNAGIVGAALAAREAVNRR